MMRIFAATPNYPPRSRVGAWLATHEFLTRLAGAGHEVTAMPLLSDGTFDPYDLDGVHVVAFDRGRVLDAGVRGADVVVSHCGDNRAAARCAQKWARPNVRFAHGRVDDPAVLDGAALVVFNSYALAGSVECSSPWIVCHPPLVAERWRTTAGDNVTLVNLSEPKGGDLFWRLARACPHVHFLGVIGGYGRQIRDRGRNVEVIATTDNMRDAVYARTRILLMPSELETWGQVALEAMVSGIPVIAHPTPGLVESLGTAGTFVDRADAQGWVDAIEELGEPARYSARAELARARAAQIADDDGPARFVEAVERLVGVSCES